MVFPSGTCSFGDGDGEYAGLQFPLAIYPVTGISIVRVFTNTGPTIGGDRELRFGLGLRLGLGLVKEQ